MKKNQFLFSAAMAGIVAGSFIANTSDALAKGKVAKDKRVPCYGVNECKMKGDCHTPKNECAGHNGCKQQGVMKTTAKECKEKGGTTTEPKGKMDTPMEDTKSK